MTTAMIVVVLVAIGVFAIRGARKHFRNEDHQN